MRNVKILPVFTMKTHAWLTLCACITMLFTAHSVNAWGSEPASHRLIVFLGLFEPNDSFQVWSVREDGNELQQLTNVPSEVINLYKLQGHRVAYRTFEAELYVLNLETGLSKKVLSYEMDKHDEFRHALSMSVSSDMSKLAVTTFQLGGHDLSIVRMDEHNEWQPIFQSKPNMLTPIVWNALNTSILYFRDKGRLKRMNLSTTQTTEIFTFQEDVFSYAISADEHIIAINFSDPKTRTAGIALYRDHALIAAIKSPYSGFDPYLSPDGRVLLYVDDGDLESHKLVLHSLESHEKKVVLEGKGAIAIPLLY